ncbi:MAG: glycosyltransferase family 4 protein [Pseudomonadota bacterium]
MKYYWVFSTFNIGGPQRRFAALAPQLGANTVHLITAMDGQYGAEALLPADFHWKHLELSVQKTALVSLANLKTFRRALDLEKPDILLTSNWGTSEWHLANRGRVRVPHVHFEDGFGPDESTDHRNWKRDLFRRGLFSTPIGAPERRFVVPSSGLGQVMKEAWGASADLVEVIPNGIDVERFAVDGRPMRRPVIGSVGALRPEKRFDRLLTICASLAPEVEFDVLIVGTGPEETKLKSMANSLGLQDRTRFAGELSDVVPALEQMDVYALTSDTEQMPISLVEAMASSLPVVATDVGDVRAMLSDGNACHVHPVGPTKPLAQSLLELMKDKKQRHALGEANRMRAETLFSLEGMTTRYRTLFQSFARD